MNTSAHIPLETLADIAEDRATSEARERAMAHVATCSECHDTLSRLERLIFMMKNDTHPDAPGDVLASAIKIFSRQMQASVRRIIATLVFDSRAAGPGFGMRSVHTSSRQLLYSAQDADLDLRITVQNEEFIVAGQVIREPCAGGVVDISGPTGAAQASLNELCEFTLAPLPAGTYSLRVTMRDVEIEIPELEVKD